MIKAMCRTILLLVLSLLALSCGGEDHRPPALSVAFDTVRGIPTVVSRGEPPVWELDTVLTLGGISASEESEQFGRVSSLVVDTSGNLFLADVLRDEILVFSPQGDFIRTVGRTGAGPGEYRNPNYLGLIGDTLAVTDLRNLRLGLFDLGGRWIGQWSIRPNLGNIIQTGAREFWISTLRLTGLEYDRVFIRHTQVGPLDTVPARPDPGRDLMKPENGFDCEFPDGYIRGFSVPFGPEIVRVPGPSGEVLESIPWVTASSSHP